MKKILFLILVFVSISFAQNTVITKISSVSPTDYNAKTGAVLITYNPTTGKFYAVQSDTLGNLKISGASTISAFPGGLSYANVRDTLMWAKSFVAYADTVRSDSVLVVRSRDTLTIGGTEWSKITIKAGAADTISFGIGTSAPSVWHTLYAGQTFVSEKLNKTYFTKVFIKGSGLADNIESYQCVIEAF